MPGCLRGGLEAAHLTTCLPAPCAKCSYDAFVEDAQPGDLLVGWGELTMCPQAGTPCGKLACPPAAIVGRLALLLQACWPLSGTADGLPVNWLPVQVVDGGMVSLEVLSKAGPDITARVVDPGGLVRNACMHEVGSSGAGAKLLE